MIRSQGAELEGVLSVFKLTGPFYTKCFALISFATFMNVMHLDNHIFAAADVQYRCKYKESGNATKIISNFTLKDDRCYRYGFTSDNFDKSKIVRCDEWVYDEPHSFVEDFGIECQDWKRTAVGTAHILGYMIGLLITGTLSDKIGRRKIIIWTGIIGGVMGLSRSITSSYWMYVVLEMMEAIIGNSYSTTYIYAIELATKENRVLFAALIQLVYGISEVAVAYIAWLLQDREIFLRVLYAPACIYILYWIFLDESVRWLFSTGRRNEAMAIIRKAAENENVRIDNETLLRLQNHETLNTTNTELLSLLRMMVSSKKILLRFLSCACMFVTSNYTYQALLVMVVSSSEDRYSNFAQTGAASICACLCLLLLVDMRRKILLTVTFILTGFCFISLLFVPEEFLWLTVFLSLCGKLTCFINFTILFLHTLELFPTCTRNTIFAACSALGAVGAVYGSQIYLLNQYSEALPVLLVGSLCVVSGVLGMIMPDCAEETLPDTVDEAKAIGSDICTKKQREYISPLLNSGRVYRVTTIPCDPRQLMTFY